MSRELTFWVSPFTSASNLNDLISVCSSQAASVSTPGRTWHGNMLLPTNYGVYPQSQCTQTLPPDALVSQPSDVTAIRQQVEAAGVGFGGWGVPNTANSGDISGQFAEACGFYACNFEPQDFWVPGDDPAAIDAWWTAFWNGRDDLSGNVLSTVVPNAWGLGAFQNSLANLAEGCNGLALETYGGPNTPAYPYPDCWPAPATALVKAAAPAGTRLIPILAIANLASQLTQANRMSSGNVHVWYI